MWLIITMYAVYTIVTDRFSLLLRLFVTIHFHTLSFTSLKITFLPSERSLILQGYCCHISLNFLLSKKQPLQDSLPVSVTSRTTLSPTLSSSFLIKNLFLLIFNFNEIANTQTSLVDAITYPPHKVCLVFIVGTPEPLKVTGVIH